MSARFALAVLLLTTACSQRSTPIPAAPLDARKPVAIASADAGPRDAAPVATRIDVAITAVEGLPSELVGARPLWESTSARRGLPMVALRLYRDGRLYSYDHRRRVLVDGQETTVEGAPVWRLAARVSKAGVANVGRQIRDRIGQGFLPLRGAAAAPQVGPGQCATAYRAWIDDEEHTSMRVLPPDCVQYDLPTPMTAIEAALWDRAVTRPVVPEPR